MGRVSREGQTRAKRACLEGYIKGVNRAVVAGKWGIPSGAYRVVRTGMCAAVCGTGKGRSGEAC